MAKYERGGTSKVKNRYLRVLSARIGHAKERVGQPKVTFKTLEGLSDANNSRR